MHPDVNTSLNRLDNVSHLSMREFRDAIIEEMCWLTGSSIAYFYATNLEEDHLTLLGYSKQVMQSCQLVERPAVYSVASTGLWGDAIRKRDVCIENDYPNSKAPSKRGYPEGHVTVLRHMNMPIFADNRIVAVVGVGNKVDPYNMDDAYKIQELFAVIWQEFQQALWAATW